MLAADFIRPCPSGWPLTLASPTTLKRQAVKPQLPDGTGRRALEGTAPAPGTGDPGAK